MPYRSAFVEIQPGCICIPHLKGLTNVVPNSLQYLPFESDPFSLFSNFRFTVGIRYLFPVNTWRMILYRLYPYVSAFLRSSLGSPVSSSCYFLQNFMSFSAPKMFRDRFELLLKQVEFMSFVSDKLSKSLPCNHCTIFLHSVTYQNHVNHQSNY